MCVAQTIGDKGDWGYGKYYVGITYADGCKGLRCSPKMIM